MNMDDIFSMFGDIFGGHSGGFGGFGGGFGGGGARQQYQGSDLRVKVKLTLQEIATGVTKKFKFARMLLVRNVMVQDAKAVHNQKHAIHVMVQDILSRPFALCSA